MKSVTQKGFTLIEVLISLAIFSIAIVGLINLSSNASLEIDRLSKSTFAIYAADYYSAKWQTDTLNQLERTEFVTLMGGIEWTIRPQVPLGDITPELPLTTLEVIAESGETYFLEVFLP